jgi:hypothetical protein
MSFATRSRCVALALAALCPMFAGAANFESAATGAHSAFLQVGAITLDRGTSTSGASAKIASMEKTVAGPLQTAQPQVGGRVSSGSRAVAKEIDLPSLLNRHFKTKVSFALDNKTKSVWISGAFERAPVPKPGEEEKSPEPYVSIQHEAGNRQLFKVLDIFTSPTPVTIQAGASKYRLSLTLDGDEPIQSQIVLTNQDRSLKEKHKVTLGEMLGALSEVAADAAVGGVNYRMLYYDDVANGGQTGATQSFVFVHTNAAGEVAVFMVPAESVPSKMIATYKMVDNKVVGLQQILDAQGRPSKLRVFDNPQ